MIIDEKSKLIRILLVEDNPSDVCLTREAFSSCKISNQLDVVDNGEKAMDYLYQRGAYAETMKPDMILLDLNLPGKDGRDVLKEIKEDPNLKRIPVVILTTSKAEQDILKTYDFHANAYIIKPVDLDQFIDAVKRIEDFWLAVVRFPPK